MYQRLVESLREEKIMNSKERFLYELEQELSNISETEREEALQYYREYFEDANMPDEDVIMQLGSAVLVANSIREELADKEVTISKEKSYNEHGSAYTKSESDDGDSVKQNVKDKKDTTIIVLLVVLGVIFSPLIIGACTAVLGVLFSVIVTVFAIFIAVAVCAIAFAMAALASLGIAFIRFMGEPLVFALLSGACMFSLGLCFLSTLATMKMATCIIPGFVSGLVKLITTPFRKTKTEIV